MPGLQQINLNKRETEGGLNIPKALAELESRGIDTSPADGLKGRELKRKVQDQQAVYQAISTRRKELFNAMPMTEDTRTESKLVMLSLVLNFDVLF